MGIQGYTYLTQFDISVIRDVLQENDILERCIDILLRCDELWVAEGWERSTGCKIEIEVAKDCGMTIRYL